MDMPGCPESRVAGVSCEVFVAVQAATNASYTVTLIYSGDYYIWLPLGMPTVGVFACLRWRVLGLTRVRVAGAEP